MILALGVLFLSVQLVLLLVVVVRLLPGRTRRGAISPVFAASTHTTVSVVIPTLNEAARLCACLKALEQQVDPLIEVIVVDGNSTDGTQEIVRRVAERDHRFSLIVEDPLPHGWIGKVWALQTALRHARGEWILGIDADTVPSRGMIGAVVGAVENDQLDVASFAPLFIGQQRAEIWVQAAMLVTLIYRCGAAGVSTGAPERILANGQCFMARRSLLERHGGYASARSSFSDDVTLARHLASRGARVGFLDGAEIIAVHSYSSLREMWREWGRSFDLKDATPVWRRWLDVALVWSAQALPVPITLVVAILLSTFPHVEGGDGIETLLLGLLTVNVAALTMRLMLLVAIRGSYSRRGAAFWLSWLADIPAAWRLTASTARVPRMWRGRQYTGLAVGDT